MQMGGRAQKGPPGQCTSGTCDLCVNISMCLAAVGGCSEGRTDPSLVGVTTFRS